MTLPFTLNIITSIVNASIETHVFPDDWKLARVKPIPKSSTVHEFKDLRPISILPVLSKVVERVVHRQLLVHVESENIIPVIQSGFRGGHGTETALAHVTDEIITASDSGLGSILVLLDFSRAFDCINQELLLEKLRHYGLSEGACSWFQSYLHDRMQYVEVEDGGGLFTKSDCRPVTRGCPQGSILSPLLHCGSG